MRVVESSYHGAIRAVSISFSSLLSRLCINPGILGEKNLSAQWEEFLLYGKCRSIEVGDVGYR